MVKNHFIVLFKDVEELLRRMATCRTMFVGTLARGHSCAVNAIRVL